MNGMVSKMTENSRITEPATSPYTTYCNYMLGGLFSVLGSERSRGHTIVQRLQIYFHDDRKFTPGRNSIVGINFSFISAIFSIMTTKLFFSKTKNHYFGAPGANSPAGTCQKLLFMITYD